MAVYSPTFRSLIEGATQIGQLDIKAHTYNRAVGPSMLQKRPNYPCFTSYIVGQVHPFTDLASPFCFYSSDFRMGLYFCYYFCGLAILSAICFFLLRTQAFVGSLVYAFWFHIHL